MILTWRKFPTKEAVLVSPDGATHATVMSSPPRGFVVKVRGEFLAFKHTDWDGMRAAQYHLRQNISTYFPGDFLEFFQVKIKEPNR